MAAEVAQLVTELLQAWNAHDLDQVAALHAANYEGEDVGLAEPQHGPEACCLALASLLHAFPDLHYLGETIVQGDRAALIWKMRGTHLGTWMHIPPTGHVVEVHGVSVLTVERNKIIRGRHIWDTAGMLRAMQLLPALAPQPA